MSSPALSAAAPAPSGPFSGPVTLGTQGGPTRLSLAWGGQPLTLCPSPWPPRHHLGALVTGLAPNLTPSAASVQLSPLPPAHLRPTTLGWKWGFWPHSYWQHFRGGREGNLYWFLEMDIGAVKICETGPKSLEEGRVLEANLGHFFRFLLLWVGLGWGGKNSARDQGIICPRPRGLGHSNRKYQEAEDRLPYFLTYDIRPHTNRTYGQHEGKDETQP